MHVAIEETDPVCFGWTPAHLGKDDVGRARKGDGAVVTAVDKQSNDLADGLAKEGVEFDRVLQSDLHRWEDQMARVKARAIWIGRATHDANNRTCFQRRPGGKPKKLREQGLPEGTVQSPS